MAHTSRVPFELSSDRVDQLRMSWLLLLAVVSSLSPFCLKPNKAHEFTRLNIEQIWNYVDFIRIRVDKQPIAIEGGTVNNKKKTWNSSFSWNGKKRQWRTTYKTCSNTTKFVCFACTEYYTHTMYPTQGILNLKQLNVEVKCVTHVFWIEAKTSKHRWVMCVESSDTRWTECWKINTSGCTTSQTMANWMHFVCQCHWKNWWKCKFHIWNVLQFQ